MDLPKNTPHLFEVLIKGHAYAKNIYFEESQKEIMTIMERGKQIEKDPENDKTI